MYHSNHSFAFALPLHWSLLTMGPLSFEDKEAVEWRAAAAKAVFKEQLRAANEAAKAKAQVAVAEAVLKEQLRASNEAAEAKAQAAVAEAQLATLDESRIFGKSKDT
ncbi:hypothetical protein CEUSTIGMA_g5983.t1 [Chlamydomonas eustigma]|uniref:Uncharacterized protein n=1 Tax=Chlamydomonas eustigma TaxID=1157962 RepID=A0A250X642_9CHLO|nr:hypothetical protein CEUSTIGMA_g5983.t1 [Chlamydomonas eustigma]|eukprot:GAX78543.1 hypothetical protein CEUSTIGMA_g5983.t1 [Chlamydomonas eustigma]